MSGTEKSKKEKKGEYFQKLLKLLNEYNKILIVTCDNIGSNHMQRIRTSLRTKGAVLLMGKNTMMRKAIRMHLDSNPQWEQLLPHITYNVGLVFTNTDLTDVRDVIVKGKVPAPAKIGAIAPNSVTVPKGMTTLEPTKTAFLQALNIASKITRNQIEILNDVPLIKEGDKVGSSEATLLQMLDIRPFEYGLKITVVYESGALYSVKVLDITDADILARFGQGVSHVAALSLSVGYASFAAFPHVVLGAFKNILSISLGTDYEFKESKKIKEILANPDAFKAVVAPVKDHRSDEGKVAKKVEEPKVEEKEESADMGFDLFG